MSCGNVPLEIVICPERSFVFAMLHRAYERINMNVVEMCLEEVSASVRCFRAAFMPSTFPTRGPVVAHFSGVMLNMGFVLLNAVECTKRKALRPIASKIPDRDLLKTNIPETKRGCAAVNLE
jgi:hypothetical protein